MDVKIILKIQIQQKQTNIFNKIFQCLQYLILEARKISMLCIEVKIVQKSFVNSQESAQ